MPEQVKCREQPCGDQRCSCMSLAQNGLPLSRSTFALPLTGTTLRCEPRYTLCSEHGTLQKFAQQMRDVSLHSDTYQRCSLHCIHIRQYCTPQLGASRQRGVAFKIRPTPAQNWVGRPLSFGRKVRIMPSRRVFRRRSSYGKYSARKVCLPHLPKFAKEPDHNSHQTPAPESVPSSIDKRFAQAQDARRKLDRPRRSPCM